MTFTNFLHTWTPGARLVGGASVRFFNNQAYHYETIRTLGEGVSGGADTGEVLAALTNIHAGNEDSWYRGWLAAAQQVEARAASLNDPISRGNALLRAANYYRTAEFFLLPEDERRTETYEKSVKDFDQGIALLGIPHEVIHVPYENDSLKAIYYPGGAESHEKPLLVVMGGYDATQEELFFFVVSSALERGYSCLTFDGPGQGGALRNGHLFTPQWEVPTKAVLDAFVGIHDEPEKIVLVGISMGGYLAPRAAAFDKRIDGVVAHNVCYDFGEAALQQAPRLVKTLYGAGFTEFVNRLMTLKMKIDPGLRWGYHNARWTMGVKRPVEGLAAFGKYNLRDVAGKITCDVLITAGEEDHFFPLHQVDDFQKALVHAQSVETRIFKRAEGGQEHCQAGTLLMFHEVLFDWLRTKYSC